MMRAQDLLEDQLGLGGLPLEGQMHTYLELGPEERPGKVRGFSGGERNVREPAGFVKVALHQRRHP
jgi:hypothetical protein